MLSSNTRRCWSANAFRSVLPGFGGLKQKNIPLKNVRLWTMIFLVICTNACVRPDLPTDRRGPRIAAGEPYDMALFADLAVLPGYADPFQLTVTPGEHGFPAGLYITSPFTTGASDRLLRLDAAGRIHVVAEGFNSIESILFATGFYDEGILYTEPASGAIKTLKANGERSDLYVNPSNDWGPTIMTYDDEATIYVPIGSTGEILRVSARHPAEVVSRMPLVPERGPFRSFAKATATIPPDLRNAFGGWLILGTHSFSTDPLVDASVDALYVLSTKNQYRQIAEGLHGLELVTFGPGGAFGRDLYVCTIGSAERTGDGAVYRLSVDGTLKKVVENIDAVSVAFDTLGILGGGMFVADMNNVPDPELASRKVWRISPK